MSSLVHAELLLEQLKKQRDRGFFCDSTIVIGPSLYQAHRNVLAAFSEFFASRRTLEEDVTRLDPEWVKEATFQRLLSFVYTGNLNIERHIQSSTADNPDFTADAEDDDSLNPIKREIEMREVGVGYGMVGEVKEEIEVEGYEWHVEEGENSNLFRSRKQGKNRPICSTCGKVLADMSSLRRHMHIHKGLKPYECLLCSRTFRQGNQLKTHMLIHTEEKLFKCDKCEKAFSQKCQLVFHCRMHHGEEKPYQCNDCRMQFATSNNLKIHCRKHTGEKPYNCEVCGQCFSQSSSLTYHMRQHTGEKPYVCATCSRAFAISSSLKIHMQKHAKEKERKAEEEATSRKRGRGRRGRGRV